MKVTQTKIPGVLVLEPRVHADDRGIFYESWNERTFRSLGLEETFVQDNHSRSRAGTLRGLHYQISRPQGKLVRVVRGAVFDVTVDLRRDSPAFGNWSGHELSATNNLMLWIPPGCAHGLYAITDADFVYKCTEFCDARDERTIRWDDPDLSIEWPLDDRTPLRVSTKDEVGVAFRDAELER